MTTHEANDNFEFVETPMTTYESDDDFGPQVFVELSPDEDKVHQDVMNTFFMLAIWASGYELDEPVEKLLAQVLKTLGIRRAFFMGDQLKVEFGRSVNFI